jgi:hypothetical protein
MNPVNLHNIHEFFDRAMTINIKEEQDKLFEEAWMEATKKQIGGDHYQGQIQPWDAIMAWELDPWLANVVKYVQRHGRKNGKEDLQKALHYLEYAIENYDLIKEKYYVRKS